MASASTVDSNSLTSLAYSLISRLWSWFSASWSRLSAGLGSRLVLALGWSRLSLVSTRLWGLESTCVVVSASLLGFGYRLLSSSSLRGEKEMVSVESKKWEEKRKNQTLRGIDDRIILLRGENEMVHSGARVVMVEQWLWRWCCGGAVVVVVEVEQW